MVTISDLQNSFTIMGRNCLQWFTNNKGADQPAHLHSLINAFVIRLLESIQSRLAMSVTSTFYQVSVAEQAGLSLALAETPKTGFLATMPISDVCTGALSCNRQTY